MQDEGDLPRAAQDFVGFVEAEVGAPLCMISVDRSGIRR